VTKHPVQANIQFLYLHIMLNDLTNPSARPKLQNKMNFTLYIQNAKGHLTTKFKYFNPKVTFL